MASPLILVSYPPARIELAERIAVALAPLELDGRARVGHASSFGADAEWLASIARLSGLRCVLVVVTSPQSPSCAVLASPRAPDPRLAIVPVVAHDDDRGRAGLEREGIEPVVLASSDDEAGLGSFVARVEAEVARLSEVEEVREAKEFDLFLSMSSRDLDRVRRGSTGVSVASFKRLLEAHRHPKTRARFRACSYDEDFDHLPTVKRAIVEKIVRCARVLVLCSEDSRRSEFVRFELRCFRELDVASNPALAVRVDASPETAFADLLEVGPDDTPMVPELTKANSREEAHRIVTAVWGGPRDAIEERFERDRRARKVVNWALSISIAVIGACVVALLRRDPTDRLIANAEEHLASQPEPLPRLSPALVARFVAHLDALHDGEVDRDAIGRVLRYLVACRADLGPVLEHADFSGADMRGAIVQGRNLSRIHMPEADLHGAAFLGCDLSDADLSGSDLSEAVLSGATMKSVRFIGADLHGAVAQGTTFADADLRDASLSSARLSDANFDGADLRRADLSGALLQGASFREAELEDAQLQWISLEDVDFTAADLRGSTWMAARDWQRSRSVEGANFHGIERAPAGFLEWLRDRDVRFIESDSEWQRVRHSRPAPPSRSPAFEPRYVVPDGQTERFTMKATFTNAMEQDGQWIEPIDSFSFEAEFEVRVDSVGNEMRFELELASIGAVDVSLSDARKDSRTATLLRTSLVALRGLRGSGRVLRTGRGLTFSFEHEQLDAQTSNTALGLESVVLSLVAPLEAEGGQSLHEVTPVSEHECEIRFSDEHSLDPTGLHPAALPFPAELLQGFERELTHRWKVDTRRLVPLEATIDILERKRFQLTAPTGAVQDIGHCTSVRCVIRTLP